ncbi:MAG: Dabb family protein [Clostridia bacterium]|nr:Dabb family protein [Clostridia bacterium]MBR0025649.1 Dabb family protein [Clostridia bacterium]
MVKHIVCMKFREKADAATAKEKLDALMGKVPTLRSMEVGLDFMQSGRSYDLVLIATYDDREGLAAYTQHPAHKEVQAYIHSVREAVVAVDFEF